MDNYVIPDSELENVDTGVRQDFEYWRRVMYERVNFNMADSKIHARAHCERVLLYALLMANEIVPDDRRAVSALAMAAVFHDTRRLDEYLDTGHGARAAAYYKKYCEENTDITYMPEAAYAMRYHDLDDNLGLEAINRDLGDNATRGVTVYRIFKDADALDRWRLGRHGLDVKYLRTDAARNLVGYARKLVSETMDADFLKTIERLVDEAIAKQRGV